MKQNISYDELVQMKQDGKIGWLDFVMKGDDAEEYKQWCENHGEEPTALCSTSFSVRCCLWCPSRTRRSMR